MMHLGVTSHRMQASGRPKWTTHAGIGVGNLQLAAAPGSRWAGGVSGTLHIAHCQWRTWDVTLLRGDVPAGSSIAWMKAKLAFWSGSVRRTYQPCKPEDPLLCLACLR